MKDSVCFLLLKCKKKLLTSTGDLSSPSTYLPNCFHLEKKSCEFISVGVKNLDANNGNGRAIL